MEIGRRNICSEDELDQIRKGEGLAGDSDHHYVPGLPIEHPMTVNDSSCHELQKAEKDKWAIGFTNLHVLKDQLHCKLQAQKAELGRLNHQHGQ